MKLRTASLGLALVALAFLSLLDVVIFRGMRERDVLESRNAGEEILNILFASLRDHQDFGSAIASSPELETTIAGLGVYDAGGEQLYGWGRVPRAYIPPTGSLPEPGLRVRRYIENPRNDSFIYLIRPFRLVPPPRGEREPPRGDGGDPPREGQRDAADHSFFFYTLRGAEIVYLEIRQPEFWGAQRLREVLFPLSEALIAVFIFFIRALILRNAEYRRRIEEQRNLVVLGTAASTLAHEIKNPLMSIRLQSSILERSVPEDSRRELRIINDEIDRLSALTYRVNDYLREPLGRPVAVDAAELARDVSRHLAGRDLVALEPGRPSLAFVDPDRLRSILENTLRNAIESGGAEEGLAIEVATQEGRVVVDVLDRGPGIARGDRARVFDPFYTTKSRGTGIGLAITRRFVEAAGGTVAIDDRPGGGCRLRLSLAMAAGGEGQ
jgi:two-component system sensor histidine kinase HydH